MVVRRDAWWCAVMHVAARCRAVLHVTAVLALALAAPAIAQPSPVDEVQRAALLLALRYAGVVVGAQLPIGNSVYEIEEIKLERGKAGEGVTITVRTKMLR